MCIRDRNRLVDNIDFPVSLTNTNCHSHIVHILLSKICYLPSRLDLLHLPRSSSERDAIIVLYSRAVIFSYKAITSNKEFPYFVDGHFKYQADVSLIRFLLPCIKQNYIFRRYSPRTVFIISNTLSICHLFFQCSLLCTVLC